QSLSPGHCALSMLFTDWNKSGQDSLRITNDRHYHRGGEEQLWRLDKDRYPRLFTRADGWQSLVIWGMGIAEGDLNADGFPEYVLTSMGDTKIQTVDVEQASEEQRPVYTDIAFARGATAHRSYHGDDLKPSTGWHAELADVNNDGLLDLFIAKGNVEQMSDFASFDPDNLLLGNHDGRFVEHGDKAGIALNRRGRGASVADFNADGLLDLLVVNRQSPLSLFRHTGFASDHGVRTGGNWLAVELKQTGSNAHALGATMAIKTGNKTQLRQIRLGGGHASGQLGFIHIGLGVAERATLRIQWPDGEWSASYRLFANHFAVITRDDEHVSYWYPPKTESE
ncbi:MAG: CRTAC1 family protein, partial [Gammaproteobacteria bacterium]|nr:CRTAC1 family protein [Gammaproteobacteria bacterium]